MQKSVLRAMSKGVRLSLGLCLIALFLSGCFLVRFFSKDFAYNSYRIVRVVMDGQSFNTDDLVLEAINPQPSTPPPPSPPTFYCHNPSNPYNPSNPRSAKRQTRFAQSRAGDQDQKSQRAGRAPRCFLD
ncbi:hypothetical protein [Helicobacter vulpis]|uniref:hypothetical protein n=1 Tax=Helicobacter vulpis TaxID=2316076 RepID=UPI000EAEDCD8|nr:hypothetical protein [Helicobacter vulpis]